MQQDNGWWSRNMGNGQQAPPPPQPTAYQAPAPPPQQQQQFQVPQQYAQPQQPQVTAENFMQAAAAWQGGEAVRTETQRCPKCGGDHFFSRANHASRLPPPAPTCMDCGYNGMFEQADSATWGA